MRRGKNYAGTVAASATKVVNFNRNQRLRVVHIQYGGGTADYTLNPDNIAGGFTTSRDHNNADYSRPASLVFEHNFDAYYDSLKIQNNSGTDLINYRIYTEEELT